MKDTMKVTGLKTKREVVELALKELLRLRRQLDFKKLKGKFHWEGDLEEMRRDK
jgi:Arc/MetJ family transcription regulator